MSDKYYIEGKAGDLLTASMWNSVQEQTKQEIADKVNALEARLKDGAQAVAAAEIATKKLKADSATVGDLTVTGTISGSSGWGAVKLYTAQVVYGQGSWSGYSGSCGWAGIDSNFGPYFTNHSATGYWWWGGGPTLSFTLGATSVVQLSSSWTWWNANSSSYNRWGQFIITNTKDSKYAPVRTTTYPSSATGDVGNQGYSRPQAPTASTFQAWLDYHYSWYQSNKTWPLAGISTQQAYVSQNTTNYGHQAAHHTESIELPAGSYTVQMAYSGYYLNVGNLQLQALVFPGGSMG